MEAASKFLIKAVELDQRGKLPEALVCYQEGSGLLFEALKSNETNDETKAKIRLQLEQYLKRAEEVKLHLQQQPPKVKHEQIEIKDGQIGCSYKTLLSRFFNDTIETVEIQDAYLRSHRQLMNLLRFCELLMLKARRLKTVNIVTGVADNDHQGQREKFTSLASSLKSLGVKMEVKYSETLHDRKIECNNGLIIKIGRGLDYFKPTPSKFCIGFCDFDLRECQQTNIDVYYPE